MAHDGIVIRSYPSTIFLYPTMLMALVAGTLTALGVDPQPLGFAFAVAFFFNVVVVSFEFRRSAPVVILLAILVLVLLGVLLNERFQVLGILGGIYDALHLVANAPFYFAVAGALALLVILIVISRRFECWEIRANEILHHRGILGDCQRLPAAGVRVTKEITDVFEFLLLQSGRLIIYPSNREAPIVLDNVPRINAVHDRIEELLDAMQVNVERQ